MSRVVDHSSSLVKFRGRDNMFGMSSGKTADTETNRVRVIGTTNRVEVMGGERFGFEEH